MLYTDNVRCGRRGDSNIGPCVGPAGHDRRPCRDRRGKYYFHREAPAYDRAHGTHVHMAEAAWSLLRTFNEFDLYGAPHADVAWYGADNTHTRAPDEELTPYAHVHAAFMQALTKICGGNVRRARYLRDLVADNGAGVTFNLRFVEPATVPVEVHNVRHVVEVTGSDFTCRTCGISSDPAPYSRDHAGVERWHTA